MAKVSKISEKDLPAYHELMDYIKELYGDKAEWASIQKQIKLLINDPYLKGTYTGIKKTLQYYHEIKKHPVTDKTCKLGVALSKFQYIEAQNYYYNLFLIEQNNKDKTIEKIEREITISAPKGRGIRNRLLDWSDNEEESIL